MASFRTVAFFFVLHFAAFIDATSKSYIVYLGGPLEEGYNVAYLHHQKLSTVLGHELAKEAMLYSYKHLFNGFSAVIPPDKVKNISKLPGVKMVLEDKVYRLQTTNSWQFLGLQNMNGTVANGKIQQTRNNGGQDVVIGMLDTGIWPESASFDDSSYSPVPENWNGSCVNTTDFSSTSDCNRKIIGARYYFQAANATQQDESILLSPRDTEGHGTHTASTAAGSFVRDANYRGFTRGTARGGAYGARLSIYKTCWNNLCSNADILAALDDGIGDGVQVFSISLSGEGAIPETKDPLAFGTLYAAMHGISIVAAAGNYGPKYATVSNVAPWMITVAATTTDRAFASNVILGDLSSFMGESLSEAALQSGFYPLVAASDVSFANISSDLSMMCIPGALDPQKSQGKIVLCSDSGVSLVVKGVAGALAKAAGLIIYNSEMQGETLEAVNYGLPAANVGYKAGQAIVAYMQSTGNPTAYITRSVTSTSGRPAPEVAAFSGRGPNLVSPEIVKPDIAAPGVSILAAYSEFHKTDSYVVISGTSMSCPHVTGIVALLKSLHPDWSPAAIQSAIITTGKTTNNVGVSIKDQTSENDATPFDIGGGEIDPQAAADPGLVYDATPGDYFLFYCQKLKLQKAPALDADCRDTETESFQLNYPSISVSLKPGTAAKITRRLKSVMEGTSTFHASVRLPTVASLTVSVRPSVLNFTQQGDEASYKMEFSLVEGFSTKQAYVYGSLTWSDDRGYRVRSPMVIKLEA
ncbi:subtilisin-like protease SBT5.4 [Selaginella moellendorffii]|nr:subtilisin-like protease SBT5.4 [Selaginella moellendorffii]|eukprot:XP_002977415.2 subtilisin-like protease SBT5.4 [Selaginella moellendorffii]